MIPNRKEILFPQFFICCENKSYFWKPIFENLAYGIPPFNSILDGNVLINKKEKYIIDDDIDIEIIQNIFSDDVVIPENYLEGKIKSINVKNALIVLRLQTQ